MLFNERQYALLQAAALLMDAEIKWDDPEVQARAIVAAVKIAVGLLEEIERRNQ